MAKRYMDWTDWADWADDSRTDSETVAEDQEPTDAQIFAQYGQTMEPRAAA